MKIAYKLIGSEMKTHKGFQWELGKWYETTGKGKLCSSSWLHFYNDPLVGLFMNPIYANIPNPRLFRAEVEGKFLDDNGLNCGYTKARLIKELPVPQISPVQRVRFAIFCVKEVYKERKWNKWADNWLSGKDRTKESAVGTIGAVRTANATWSAVCTAKNTAHTFHVTWNTANVVCTARAVRTTDAANTANATESAALAALAAWSALWSAAYAAENTAHAFHATWNTANAVGTVGVAWSADENGKFDLIGIAQKAMEE